MAKKLVSIDDAKTGEAALPEAVNAVLRNTYAPRTTSGLLDVTATPNGPVPTTAETGQTVKTFGNSPLSVQGGRLVHTPQVPSNSAGYAQLSFPNPVTEVVLDAEFPAESTGAVAIILPSGENGWGPGVSAPAGVHLVLYGTGRYRLAYWTGSAEQMYRTGMIPDMRDGKLRRLTVAVDHVNSAVSVLFPNGEVLTHTAATVASASGRHAVAELYEVANTDVPAKIARFWAATEDDPAVRARPTLGDIARAVDMRTASVAPSVAELTSTSQSVDLPMAYNSTIRKTIKRPPSGKVAVTIEVMLSVTAACRVFFRCGQEAVGGTTQGAQGTVEELVNATADTVPLFQKAVATGVVTIPDNVSECDIVGSLNQSGGAAGNAKYLLDSGSGRRIRMTVTPIA